MKRRRTSKGAELRRERGRSGTIYFVHHIPKGVPRWTVFTEASEGLVKTSLRKSARDCGGKSWNDIRAKWQAEEAYDMAVIRLCRRKNGTSVRQLIRQVPGFPGWALQNVTRVGKRHGYRVQVTGTHGKKRYRLI
jgi:hypothetical protein